MGSLDKNGITFKDVFVAGLAGAAAVGIGIGAALGTKSCTESAFEGDGQPDILDVRSTSKAVADVVGSPQVNAKRDHIRKQFLQGTMIATPPGDTPEPSAFGSGAALPDAATPTEPELALVPGPEPKPDLEKPDPYAHMKKLTDDFKNAADELEEKGLAGFVSAYDSNPKESTALRSRDGKWVLNAMYFEDGLEVTFVSTKSNQVNGTIQYKVSMIAPGNDIDYYVNDRLVSSFSYEDSEGGEILKANKLPTLAAALPDFITAMKTAKKAL